MNTRNVTFIAIIIMAVSGLLQAGTALPLKIFTSNGIFGDDPGFNVSVEPFKLLDDDDKVGLLFVNNSTLDISVASLYIDSLLLTGEMSVENGPGTDFVVPASPPYLPGSSVLPGGKIGMWSAKAAAPGAGKRHK